MLYFVSMKNIVIKKYHVQVATREQYPVSHPEIPGYPGPDILAFTTQQKE